MSFAVNPAGAGVQPLRTAASVQGRKDADRFRRRALPVQSKVDIALPPPAATTTTAGSSAAARPKHNRSAARSKIVNQAKVYGVSVRVLRGYQMKVLPGGRRSHVRQRNELQQRCRRGTEAARINFVR